MKIKRVFLALVSSILLIMAVCITSAALGLSKTSPGMPLTPAQAQSDTPPPGPLTLTDEQSEYQLGRYLEILKDPTGKLTIKEVTSPEYDSQFVHSQVDVPNYGFTDNVFWVRVRLDNQTIQTNEWLLEQGFANTHYIDLYTPAPDREGYSVKQSGVLRPVQTRDLLFPRIIFSLTIPPGSQQTYYLRFQSGASMTLALTLWTRSAFLNHSLVEQLFMGIFYGVLIGLLFYNLFLFISLREANYLFFVILLACLIFEEASYGGYLPAYFNQGQHLPIQYIEPIAFPLLIGSLVLFSDSFLELKTQLPKLHAISLINLTVWGALVLLIPFASYGFLANLMAPWALISLVIILIAGVATWMGGYRPARFFMLAWLGLVFSLMWVVLVRLGVVPSTFLSENAFLLSYLWMAVCWSIALADRINLMKVEAESANRDLQTSENRLAQILEGLPIGVVLYGKDQTPRYVNRRAIDILSNPTQGIQPDISAGRTLAQAIKYYSLKKSGSDQEYPLENMPIYNALHGESAVAEDIEVDQGDKRVPLEIMASPVRDDSGDVESAVVAFQDITLRKQAETAMRMSETRFRVIAENNFDGILFMDRDRKILYVSPFYKQLIGRSAEELVGETGTDYIHPDDREYAAIRFTELLQQPYTRIIAQYRLLHKDGSSVWIETNAINLLDDPDVQAVILNSHDITERKRTEAELFEYQKQLETLVEERTTEVQAVNEQLQMRIYWLSAVNLVNQIMARSADFAQIYQKILEVINNLLITDGALIAEWDAAGKELKILAHTHRGEISHHLVGTITTISDNILSFLSWGESELIYLSGEQLSTISGAMGRHILDSQVQNMALVPLILRENLFGFLGLEMIQESKQLTDEEINLVKIFSVDIAQLIEDSRLFEQTKVLIAVEERNRLARDLHDSVTQVLFSATLLADVLPQIWQRDPEQGMQRLEKLQRLTRGALAEMRSLLLELRPATMINTPLGDLLAQLTEATASRSGLPFRLYLEKVPQFPEDVQTNFYRIAQEALSNVVKHAQARQVVVSLSSTLIPQDENAGVKREVRLMIQDDGVGFYTREIKPAHLGVEIMRERAAAIGATLSIESEPGHGTQVTLIWLSKAEELQ